MKIDEKIFEKNYDGLINYFKYSDLPTDLLPDDKIVVRYDEGHYSENDSWDAQTDVIVLREREETKEEEVSRLAKIEKEIERQCKKRYESYLRLKEEFEIEKQRADELLGQEFLDNFGSDLN